MISADERHQSVERGIDLEMNLATKVGFMLLALLKNTAIHWNGLQNHLGCVSKLRLNPPSPSQKPWFSGVPSNQSQGTFKNKQATHIETDHHREHIFQGTCPHGFL